MRNFFGILLSFITVSFFYFPVVITFFPVTNTKNMLAVLGGILLLYSFVQRREFVLSKDIIILLVLSTFVMVITLFSVTVNHTPEKSYTVYLLTALIWLLGAYATCFIIRATHNRLDFPLILNYLCAVCVFQCVMALLINQIPAVQVAVDSMFSQGQEFFHEKERLYGIGASLDIAGTRFACVLAAIPVLLHVKRDEYNWKTVSLYIACFIVITVGGNIIARTTTVGVGLGLGFLGIMVLKDILSRNVSERGNLIWMWFLAIIIIVPAGIILYKNSEEIRTLLRFGFEGFFNLAETGEFRTQSSDLLLKKMIVFPEDLRTYILGDGYFENSRNDINYLGDSTTMGFYMGTDIGYLRFIFLFGVPGLIAISLVMIHAALTAGKAFPEYKWAFYLAMICGFIIWFKVATDIFPFLAIGVSASLVKDLLDFEEETKPDSNSV